MNLFLIVWVIDSEPNWTHVISDKPYLSDSEEKNIIVKFMVDWHGYTKNEVLEVLDDYWSNKVSLVDGYEIKVTEVNERQLV